MSYLTVSHRNRKTGSKQSEKRKKEFFAVVSWSVMSGSLKQTFRNAYKFARNGHALTEIEAAKVFSQIPGVAANVQDKSIIISVVVAQLEENLRASCRSCRQSFRVITTIDRLEDSIKERHAHAFAAFM